MSNQDGKLFATAMGAATAGAALAVMAMKMIESNNKGKGSSSSDNLLAYHPDDKRPIRTSVIMNDPSDLVGDGSSSSMVSMVCRRWAVQAAGSRRLWSFGSMCCCLQCIPHLLSEHNSRVNRGLW